MHATQTMPNFQQLHIKHFNKYDFVKSFTASISDPKVREEEERKAVIIADAIEETQKVLFEHLATKEDLKLLESQLESSLATKLQIQKYQLIGAVAALITFLPPFAEFVKKLFGF